MVAQKVPLTPHNQKRTEGPLPSLVSTLRSDNRDQLISLLSLDPLANVLNFDEFQTEGKSSPLPISHKTRLVFASESLRSLLMYHTLADTESKSVLMKPKVKTPRKVHSIFTPEEESLGLFSNNPFGIVGTRILLDDWCQNNGNEDKLVPGSFTVPGIGHGTETIYNPQRNKSVFASSMHDARDETDGASVVIYFILPIPKHIQAVSKVIHSAINSQKIMSNNPFEPPTTGSRIIKHRIVFLPRITALSKRILVDENITKRRDVAVHTLDINLIPIEDDVITCLEMEQTINDCYINKTPSEHVTHVAQSLRKVQDICGTIPRVQSYGILGEMVLERMMSLRLEEYDPYDEEGEEDGQETNPEVKAAIILDRAVDFVTPLITPLTYEGLLDDLLKIDAG
jgi:hypothetical protein